MARLVTALLFVCTFLAGGRSPAAPTAWEVAVVFLGYGETPEFQTAIDKNIAELLSVPAGPNLRISILREFNDREVTLHRRPTLRNPVHPVHLYSSDPENAPLLPGRLTSTSRLPGKHPILSKPDKLTKFFAEAFRESGTRRILVVYGHGFAFDGFRNLGVKELRYSLEESLPLREGKKPLDLFWMDSCFMGNWETAFELRGLSDYIAASEEAEFDSGSPFGLLDETLGEASEPRQAAIELSKKYLESYSYLLQGSQKTSVMKSSATISVVETDLLEGQLEQAALIARSLSALSEAERKSLVRGLKNIEMERTGLVDYGSLLYAIRKQEKLPDEIRSLAKSAIANLDLNHEKRIKTVPRIRVHAPNSGDLLVFGYDNWSRGFEGDLSLSPDVLPSNMQPRLYVEGPNRQKWPARPVNIRLDLKPFSVGLKVFSYYFADPNTMSAKTEAVSMSRDQDLYFFESSKKGNPIVFSGYTQGIGAAAEVYTGLSILNPLVGQSISFDYQELEFAQKTSWGRN